MTRFLLVPGRGVPRPEHWLRRWSAAHPSYVWAPEPPPPPIVLRDRVAALERALRASDEPAVLIAHSAGCIATVVWAAQQAGPVPQSGPVRAAGPVRDTGLVQGAGPVRAALLVTPPDLAGAELPGPGEDIPWVVPRARLPFPAILVASRTDPHCPYAVSERYAADWGAELVDAGDAGHLDTASGYGPWPAGAELLRRLA